MADETEGAVPEEASVSRADSDGDAATEGPADVKQKFLEALEAKKGRKHANNGPHEDGGASGPGGSNIISRRREFRRKSG